MTGIVQAVQTNLTTYFQTAAGGWVLVPGLAVTITPNSVANQIILMGKINLASDGQAGVAYKIQRNGVDIDIGAASGLKTQASGCSFGTSAQLDSGIALSEYYLDSPASVAAQTYQVYVNRGGSSTATINGSHVATDAANFFRATSNLIALEFQP